MPRLIRTNSFNESRSGADEPDASLDAHGMSLETVCSQGG
jgi:hypothetical protein